MPLHSAFYILALLYFIFFIINIPKVQDDTPEELEDLTDTFGQHIRVLRVYSVNRPIGNTNGCLVYLVI
jgi:hypothetical protein